jgi:hypothetical protein
MAQQPPTYQQQIHLLQSRFRSTRDIWEYLSDRRE